MSLKGFDMNGRANEGNMLRMLMFANALTAIPMTHRSKIWFVNFVLGSDSNDGESWAYPLKTVVKALSKVRSGYNDVIILQPCPLTVAGAASVITEADISVAKSDLSIIALNDPTNQSIIFRQTTDPSTSVFNLTAAADRVLFKGLAFDGNGDGGKDVWAFNIVGGSVGGTIKNCRFFRGNGIKSTNAASASEWVIEDNKFIDIDTEIIGYFNLGMIRRNRSVKTATGALTVSISLLDTTTADSDGAIIENNTILGGIVGTTPRATGISVAAACYGVGIIDNRVAGCTDNLSYTQSTAGCYGINNKTDDGGQGGAEYADTEDNLNS